jgi:ATP-dependent DNA helicase RecQ
VLVVDPAVTLPEIRASRSEAADEGLVERLRAWRLERSREDGVPAYVVLHDATLNEVAAVQPRSEGELAGIKGLGPVKVDRYGDDLLAVIAAP